ELHHLSTIARRMSMSRDEAAQKTESAKKAGGYGAYWDYYVDNWETYHQSDGANLKWAGDEWGNPQGWEGLYQELFSASGVAQCQRVVEIGPGSGKYTLKVLESSPCRIRAYDVSQRFLTVCETRCREWTERQRLSLHLLHAVRPNELLEDLRE